MNRQMSLKVGAGVLILAAVGFGYWIGESRGRIGAPVVTARSTEGPQRSGTAGSAVNGSRRRILYYRNAMGLSDTSPVPKKDSMGMDYIPVYADENTSGANVHIGADRLQKMGVRTEPAAARVLTQTLRIVGTVQADESRQSTISPRFEGWITQLFVSTTGAQVSRGQPLLEVYSPDLLSAQQDYLIAARTLQSLGDGDPTAHSAMQRLVQSSLERLRNWDIADSDLTALQTGEAPRRTMILRASRAGVITEKTARAGMRFMPGDPLYQIADLSTVWLVGNVFEQDLALVQVGAPVTVTAVAYPGKRFQGKVTFISPVLQPETRTAQLRVELANHAGLMKPSMYASVELAAGPRAPRLAVPDSAILDTGTRQLVLIDRGGGEFEPRTVQSGLHADGYTEILTGVAAGEAVVVNGNFLIDSESNLRAAIRGLGSRDQAAPAAPPTPAPPSAAQER
jgi:membrane fusion protein, copper/silver efflux system